MNKLLTYLLLIIVASAAVGCGEDSINEIKSDLKKNETQVDNPILIRKDSIISCDYSWVLKLNQKIVKKINEKDIYTLFKSINPQCNNNVEYSEIMNETIWLCLINSIDDFAFAFAANISDAQRTYILNVIENPICDIFDCNVDMSKINVRNLKSERHINNLKKSIRVVQYKNSKN